MITNNIDLYKIWAPDDAEWTAWAKPVLFASLFTNTSYLTGDGLNIPETPVLHDSRTMIIVDLPGRQSVEEALAFARKGYRPVPLYNGVMGEGKKLVDVVELGNALYKGAAILKSIPLNSNAPPVFMLDNNRMAENRVPGAYDNRWCIFQQDMPSAEYLKDRGMNKIVVRTVRYIQTDLERILYDYQKNGIALLILQNNANLPTAMTARKQSLGKEWAYRLKVTTGLKRNAAGGFGGKIPDAYESNSGSGRGYYGIG